MVRDLHPLTCLGGNGFAPDMKDTAQFSIILVTAPDLNTARTLAHSTLTARLAACVNLLPKVESHYWWKGKVESGSEVLMIFKTRRSIIPRLKRHVLAEHPYETPEFVVLDIASGSTAYLRWIRESVS